jgi:Na+/pantothenate symporter
VSELTSISGAINSLTNLNGLPATIVEVVVTLIVRVLMLLVSLILMRVVQYTAFGGFRTSLVTDNVQGVMICLLCTCPRLGLPFKCSCFAVIICTVAIGTQAHIEKAAVEASGLLNATKLGWQLLYILPVAIVFNSSSPSYNRLH